jgi:hypothetical protein
MAEGLQPGVRRAHVSLVDRELLGLPISQVLLDGRKK